MGLTCQLLGHQFGEPATERMREERGDEMVTTEREVRVCARCGDRLVISQNTEVVAIRHAESGDEGTTRERVNHTGDAHLDDIVDPSFRPPTEPTSTASPTSTPAPTSPPTPTPAPTSTPVTGESVPDTSPTSGTDAFDPGTADPSDEDAEILEEPRSASESAAEPTQGSTGNDPVEPVRSSAPNDTSTDTVDSSDEPVDVADLPNEAVEFYCPACGYAVAVTLTSMRSGDICPACHQGYIDERRRR